MSSILALRVSSKSEMACWTVCHQESRSAACVAHWLWSMQQAVRDFFKESMYCFRGVPILRYPEDNSPYSMILGRQCFSILETCPAQWSCTLYLHVRIVCWMHCTGHCLPWPACYQLLCQSWRQTRSRTTSSWSGGQPSVLFIRWKCFLWCELMQNFRLLQADFKAKDLSSFWKTGRDSLHSCLCVSKEDGIVSTQQLPDL